MTDFVKKMELPYHLKILVCLKTRNCWPWQLTKKSFKQTILKLAAKEIGKQIASELHKYLSLHSEMCPGVHSRFRKVKKVAKIAKHIQIIGGKHVYTLMKQPCEKDISELLEIHTNLLDFGVNSAYFAQATDYAQALAQVSCCAL